jgi:hypothetical protein
MREEEDALPAPSGNPELKPLDTSFESEAIGQREWSCIETACRDGFAQGFRMKPLGRRGETLIERLTVQIWNPANP